MPAQSEINEAAHETLVIAELLEFIGRAGLGGEAPPVSGLLYLGERLTAAGGILAEVSRKFDD